MQNFNVKKNLARVKEENIMAINVLLVLVVVRKLIESGILNTETLSASARKISRNVMENMVNNGKSRNDYVLFDINIDTTYS